MSLQISKQFLRDRLKASHSSTIDIVDRAFPPARSTTYFTQQRGRQNG